MRSSLSILIVTDVAAIWTVLMTIPAQMTTATMGPAIILPKFAMMGTIVLLTHLTVPDAFIPLEYAMIGMPVPMMPVSMENAYIPQESATMVIPVLKINAIA